MSEKPEPQALCGIDIGGTKTVVALARADGEIVAESRLEHWTSGRPELDLEKLEQHVRVLLRGASVPLEEVRALGISAPGPLDAGRGIVLDAPNLPGWRDVRVKQTFEDRLKVRVRLENDANAAALAERRFGAGRGVQNLIFLTMSTGVGAGLILNGRIHRGGSFQAGEIGHVPVTTSGRRCACGLSGCLEAYVGGAALADIIREDLARGEQSLIPELVEGDASRVSAEVWVEALRAGDGYAQRLRHTFLDYLAQGIAIAITTLDPEIVVLGTIVEHNPDLFIDALSERVRKLTWPSLHHVRLVPGELGTRRPAYAALSVAALADELPDSPAA